MNARNYKKLQTSNDFSLDIECPYCSSTKLKKNGKDEYGRQRYRCNNCHRYFTEKSVEKNENTFSNVSRTKLIIDILNRVHSPSNSSNLTYISIKALNEIFAALKNIRKDEKLFGNKIAISELYLNFSNNGLKQINNKIFSFNNKQKMCIGLALDSFHLIAIYEGIGNSNKELTNDTFSNLIKFKSTIHHNGNKIYKELVKNLNLKEVIMKKDVNEKDPLSHLYKIKEKLFLYLTSVKNLNGSNIQDYLNLYCFLFNKPCSFKKKIDDVLSDYIKQADFIIESSSKSSCEAV